MLCFVIILRLIVRNSLYTALNKIKKIVFCFVFCVYKLLLHQTALGDMDVIPYET